MVNNSASKDFDMSDLRSKVEKMEKEFKKSINNNMDALSDIIKKVGYKKEKKGKVNKKEATMYLADDDSHIKIVFSDAKDNIKFFDGIKE